MGTPDREIELYPASLSTYKIALPFEKEMRRETFLGG